ncbi:hypothetical protein BRD14_02060 [Halobacteriales archaeon SW_5_68_122]|nr:MAG: hypothetical protein BRD14_02060 [Halobacteriales archaeon SW_5_68_122]
MVRSREGVFVSLLLASALLCSAVAPGAAGAGDASEAAPDGAGVIGSVGSASLGAPTLLQGFEADRTSFRITLYENGSAEWRFRYEKGLNESEREDFEAFAERFNENETDLYTNFRKRARWLTDNGSTATGREMSAEGFDREARTEGLDPQSRTLGVVEMSFRWEGFAQVRDDGRVEAGDVFQGGLYIGPDQELVFSAGPNLVFAEALPEGSRVVSAGALAESGAVTWSGERSFNDGRPRVVLTDEAAGGEAATTADAATATGMPAGATPGWLFPVGVLLVVVLVGGGAAVAYRGSAFSSDDGGVAAGSTNDDGGGAGAAGAEAEPAVGVTEAELLSDEERVVSLLEDNGGRMKQVNIVEETDWSKSKVSMLLSDMEEDEEISKLRVGRENIVSLTGHEPDAAGSPFDDEE